MTVLNISSTSEDWRVRWLSNFSAHAFILDGVLLASVEGFIQGIKFPEGHEKREEAFGLTGFQAKKLGRHADRLFVWWNGQAITFGTAEHHALIARAIRAKFEQNLEAMEALWATGDLTITHDLGHPDHPNTSLPRNVFCDILTQIRQETS